MIPETDQLDWPCDLLAAQDRAAWQKAFMRLYPWMREVVVTLTKGRLDVVREEAEVVIEQLFDRWDQVMISFRPPKELDQLPNALKSYVHVILDHDVSSLLRRHRYSRGSVSMHDLEYGQYGFDLADDSYDEEERIDLIELKTILDSLPDQDMQIIRLVFWEERKIEYVAREIQTSKSTAHRKIVEIINKLKQRLGVTVD